MTPTINIFLNYFLYVFGFALLLIYLANRYKNKFSKRYYALFLSILVVYIIGVALAFYMGMELKNPETYFISDLLQSAVFPLSLALIGLVANFKDIRKIKKSINFFILIFIVSLFIQEITTVKLYNLSYLGFYGLYLITNSSHKNIGRLIVLLSWCVALLSLAKWNFFVIIAFPFLWGLIERREMSIKSKLIIALIIVTVSVTIVFHFGDNIIQVTNKEGYHTFEEYWDSRVVPSDASEERFMRSSGRYIIWNDLLKQLAESPLTGIGFGARPILLDVSDHNMYIFYLVRFGIPLFCVFSLLVLTLFINIFMYKDIGTSNRLILFFLCIYFFLSASIGHSFGQLLNGLTFGVIAGLILNPRSFYHSTVMCKHDDIT